MTSIYPQATFEIKFYEPLPFPCCFQACILLISVSGSIFQVKFISPHCQNKALGAKLVVLTKRFMWPIEVNDLKNQLCYKPVCTYRREPNWNGRRILSHSHWSEILLRYSHHQLSLSVQFSYRSICQKNSAQQRCLRDQIWNRTFMNTLTLFVERELFLRNNITFF